MTRSLRENIFKKTLNISLVIFFIFFISAFFYSITHRVFYPFELNWLEGEMFLNSLRVLEGKTIYQEPSSEFITEIYPPVFYWIGSFFLFIFGEKIWALRLISLCSVALLCYLIHRISIYEKKGIVASLAGISIFLAFYQVSGTWYDVARVDMLFFAITSWGLYFLSLHKNIWRLLLGTIILIIASFTKQAGIFYVLAAFLYIFLKDKKRSMFFIGIFLFVFGSAIYIYNLSTEGWFLVYAFNNPKHIPISDDFISKMIKEIVPYLLIFGFVSWNLWQRIFKNKEAPDIWDLAFLISIFSFVFISCRVGAYLNDHIPLTYFSSLIFALKIFNVDKYILKNKLNLKIISKAILVIQMVILLYNPLKYIPSQRSIDFGKAFIERISEIEGEVFIPFHQFYAYLAGKKTYLSACALWAYRFGNYYYPEEIIDKLRKKKFSIIVTDDVEDLNGIFLGKEISEKIIKNYSLKECLFYCNDVEFNVPAERKFRPLAIYYPKKF